MFGHWASINSTRDGETVVEVEKVTLDFEEEEEASWLVNLAPPTLVEGKTENAATRSSNIQ